MRLDPGSLAARTAGEELTPPSRITIRESSVGEGLEVSGWAVIDELPEAIERRRRFALGVQWHPEADETSRLIAALVVEAAAHRAAAVR